MMRKTLCMLVSLLLCLVAYSQQQDERIINFHSDIVIDTAGRIQVTEHIKVYAAGKEIKRGIVRQIPVYRNDVNGNRVKVDIRILSVMCNGRNAKYHSENKDGNIVVYVGDKEILLKPDVYDYAIEYESRGHIGFFDDYDELYWNVTGTDSDLTIEKASAAITLPDGVKAIQTACYTGPKGSKATDCNVDDQGNRQVFSTKHSLRSREGLTIAVAFQRNIIKRPPPPGKAEKLWEAYKRYISALAGILIAGCFFFFTWLKVGKDPEQPVAIPTFHPPHNWSPAVTRYLYKRKYDNKVFTAALVGMAVKGAISIKYGKPQMPDRLKWEGTTTITSNGVKRTTMTEGDMHPFAERALKGIMSIIGRKQYTLEKGTNVQQLHPEEEEVYDTLFETSDTLTVSNTNHTRFSEAIADLQDAIKEKWNMKDFFLKNWKYVVFGGIITVAVMVAYMLLAGVESIVGLSLSSPIIMMGVAILAIAIRINQKPGCAGIFYVLCISIFLVACCVILFASGGLAAIGSMLSGIHWVTIAFLTLMPLSYAVYIYLIKAPTVLGAKTTTELEGFRMYLKTAEEHRLNMLTPPEKTPELFEKLLPYAIALDVDNEWCKKFDNVLKQFNYEPQWYQGSGPFVFTNFGHSFARSFDSSLSSARVDPSSSSSGSGSWSSGSSGGGFSGGGGGGGSVGGW